MDVAKEKSDNVQSTMRLLMHQWQQLDLHLEAEDSFGLKLREMKERENRIVLKVRGSELREGERQKELERKQEMLNKRILELDSQELLLAKMENDNRSELQRIFKEESELNLAMKKVADHQESLDAKLMMKSFAGECSQSKLGHELDLKSAANSPSFGSAGNVEQNVKQSQDGICFMVTMRASHEAKNFLAVPVSFAACYDLSSKKQVILLTEKGSYLHNVKQYVCPSASGAGRAAIFSRGWKGLNRKNRLRTGMQCLFQVKEDAVNGDDSVFSMEVTVV